jgi:cytoskeletal protein CcmA (bactofilin family)
MGIDTNKRSLISNLKITGSSTAAGGLYDRMKIVGEGIIEGDTKCRLLKCIGTLEMEGNLQASEAGIVGTFALTGNVRSDTMKNSGTVSISGDAEIGSLTGSGTIEVKGHMQGTKIALKGHIAAGGDCEVDVFNLKGMFDVGGLLNAGEIDIRLFQDSTAKEIGGERIRIRKASLLHPFSLFFRPSPHAKVTVSVIEGDDIYVEHTNAKVVRGNQVVIGPGCEVDLVEYKVHLEKKKGAIVKESRKL